MLESGTRTSLSIAMMILILGIFVVSRFLVFPLISTYWMNQQKISDGMALLHRYQTLLAEEPLLQQRLSEYHDNMDAQTVYLEGPTTALAGAELQDRVRHALSKVNGEVESTEILSVVAVDGKDTLDRVGLRVRISATNISLVSILHDLEFGEPHLILDKLVVSKKANSSSNEASYGETHLDVAFDVFGLLPKSMLQ